jgi:hypothetical protein
MTAVTLHRSLLRLVRPALALFVWVLRSATGTMRPALALVAAVSLAAPATAPAASAGGVQAPHSSALVRPRIVFVRCSAVPFPCVSHTTVTRTGKLLVGAGGMSGRAKVVFPVRSASGKRGSRSVGGSFRTTTRIVVRVPADAVSGRIRVVNPGGKTSNAVRIGVKRPPPKRRPVNSGGAGPSAFDGDGMWIWYLSKSEGGSIPAIAARAKANGISTVYVKSADGTNVWSQFSATAVAALKAAGLHVCGWQFVYGSDPVGEAAAAAVSQQNGADCFAIDAEGAYEGKYAQAQKYMTALRAAVGPDFPLSLASFPYVDYHPGLPFSVFLGPGNATANQPQVYWKTIGTTVDASLAHTYEWNAPYGRSVFPLGQTYDSPKAADIRRFRQLSQGYGARGVSWWDWQEASDSDWAAVGASLDPLPPPAQQWPTLAVGAGGKVGSKGDVVVWAQQHLAGAGQPVTVDGQFGAGTATAVRAFQSASGLPVTGAVDAATWPALMKTPVAPVDWVAKAQAQAKAKTSAAQGARAASATAGLPAGPNGPASADLPAKRDEIPPGALR